MAIRQPPDDHLPRVVRGRRASVPRVIRYEEPPRSFFRRLAGFLLRPYIIIPAVVIVLIAGATLVYYWVVFSARIDNLLRGEVFTRSAGIYAAPKLLRPGESLSEDDLIAYLKRAGYVERNQQADSARGRYSLNGQTVEIDPGNDSVIDTTRPFDSLRVEYSRGGKSIAYVTNRENGAH